MRGFLVVAVLGLAACAPPDPAVVAQANWEACEYSPLAETRLAACSRVIANTPDDQQRALAYMYRGLARQELDQGVRAIADFGRALRLSPQLAQAYYLRGGLHSARGEYASATADYDAALRIDPTMLEAAQARDVALQGDLRALDSQIAQIDAALRQNPNNAALLNERCWMRVSNDGDLDLALADCERSLQLRPRDAATLDSLGLVRLKRGEYQASIAAYDAALREEPGSGHFLYGRGVARIRLGLTVQGQADLAEAERAVPGIARTYRSYGVTPEAPPIQDAANPGDTTDLSVEAPGQKPEGLEGGAKPE